MQNFHLESSDNGAGHIPDNKQQMSISISVVSCLGVVHRLRSSSAVSARWSLKEWHQRLHRDNAHIWT